MLVCILCGCLAGAVTGILHVKFKIPAIAKLRNATCERPSPIKENLFNTSVTPKRDEQSAIRTPTISAYRTNGYSKYNINFSIRQEFF